jgi:CheY-like chemotaxis protein
MIKAFKERILLVEDCEDLAKNMKAIYESDDIDIDIAATVEEAILRLKLKEYTSIVLDYDLGMDYKLHKRRTGLEVMEYLKKNNITIPVCANSGSPDFMDILIKAGAKFGTMSIKCREYR